MPLIEKKNSNLTYVIAGFTSGCMTRFFCQPLDVVKIRFQLQVEPISRSSSVSKYRSLTQTFVCIIREESIIALWKGHIPAQILSGIYGNLHDLKYFIFKYFILLGMAYFSSFEMLNQLTFEWFFKYENFISRNLLQYQPLVHFVCGSFAGCSATLMSHPFDVIRTRMISQCNFTKTYNNSRQAIYLLVKNEGFFGLYRGFLPTIIQIMPYSGSQFAIYKVLKKYCLKYNDNPDYIMFNIFKVYEKKIQIQSSLICGAFSGLFAKVLVYPLDFIKKRLQIRGFEKHRGKNFGYTPRYEGFIHCIIYTFRTEKLSAFYKGLVPSTLKATISSALHFWLYEIFVKMLNN